MSSNELRPPSPCMLINAKIPGTFLAAILPHLLSVAHTPATARLIFSSDRDHEAALQLSLKVINKLSTSSIQIRWPTTVRHKRTTESPLNIHNKRRMRPHL